MKILILNWRDTKNPKAGGNEIMFQEYAKEWVKKGHQVTMLTGGWRGCKRRETVDGIKIVRVGDEMSLYLLAPLAYFKLKPKPDVIIDVSNGIPFFTPLFCKKRKYLHINHLHTKVWEWQSEGKGLKMKIIAKVGNFLEKLTPLIYRNIPIITISKSSAREIKKEFGIKPVGIVNPAFSKFAKNLKVKKTKNPSILLLNRIKKYKGVKTLLDAVSMIDKNIDVGIAGTGDYLGGMKGYTWLKRLENNIWFFGRVSEKEKAELMQKAWIFINPSWKEGFGIVNLEAGYLGTPTIGSNTTGIKDSIIDGKTGLLFKIGDYKDLAKKITYLIKNKKIREKLGKEAQKFAKSFSWQKSAEEYLGVLENE